jgi:hypothetical protein
MRPKGIKGEQTPVGPVLREAEQWLKEREETQAKKAEARANRPLLNKHTYAWLYEEYQARVAAGGTRKLPQCKRCDAILHWEEPAHECPGFVPKYPDWDADKRQWVHWYTNTADGYVDWDDDQYDPSVGGEVEKNPDEEDSGTVSHCQYMTEEEWLEWKFRNR